MCDIRCFMFDGFASGRLRFYNAPNFRLLGYAEFASESVVG
jgi:hypothetical protein